MMTISASLLVIIGVALIVVFSVIGFVLGSATVKETEVYIDDPEKVALQGRVYKAESEVKTLKAELRELHNQKLEDTNIQLATLKAQLAGKDDIISQFYLDAEKFRAKLIIKTNQADKLSGELEELKAWVLEEINKPGYGQVLDHDERYELVRQLYNKGWSRWRIERHLWGYAGGRAYEHVRMALQNYLTTDNPTD